VENVRENRGREIKRCVKNYQQYQTKLFIYNYHLPSALSASGPAGNWKNQEVAKTWQSGKLIT
jgi:hypothetical protein